ncbi:unnamed protein product, partial [Mesorhabditis belari]|uniref:DNA replication complex GINS protein SLD5 n=1 Tax=Mesorhabditis belari TaxID=2138241 RepID=A0AAF3FDQ2_9BILA
MDDNEDDITPAQVVADMRTAWHSESVSPCLLQSRLELVHCLVDQIEEMDKNLMTVQDRTHIKVSLHRLELQRLNYMINSYMRLRLKKIEENPIFLLEKHKEGIEKNKPPLMSEEELKFAHRFATAQTSVFSSTITQHLPASLARVPVPSEDLSVERVFISVESDDVEDVAVPEGDDPNSELLLPMQRENIYFLPLLSILPALEKNQVRLL